VVTHFKLWLDYTVAKAKHLPVWSPPPFPLFFQPCAEHSTEITSNSHQTRSCPNPPSSRQTKHPRWSCRQSFLDHSFLKVLPLVCSTLNFFSLCNRYFFLLFFETWSFLLKSASFCLQYIELSYSASDQLFLIVASKTLVYSLKPSCEYHPCYL